jgi:hypothetical protein
MPVFKEEYHKAIFVFFLMVFAAALPLSKFLMSLALWMLALNWFLGGHYRGKLQRLWQNKAVMVFLGLFALHLVGLIWTGDFQYALKDLRVKLPLLILPFILASGPSLSAKQFRNILLVHAAAVVAGSLFISWGVFVEGLDDPREASVLISHIRFALNICVAIFSLVYFLLKKDHAATWLKVMMGLSLAWLLAFLFILQSFTGLAVFAITALFMLVRAAFLHARRPVKVALVLIILAILTFAFVMSAGIYRKHFSAGQLDISQLEYFTPSGNMYVHNLSSRQTENGNYLWIYVCEEELREGWNARSTIHYDSSDHNNQKLRYTLVRFLTSKGLRKDLEGIQQLTEDEVAAIENGVPNVSYLHAPGFVNRIEKVFWEISDYRHTGDPTNHSFMQRVELWKASLAVIADHPLAGVGTGDVRGDFASKLREVNSPLQASNMRSHNQFLAMAIAFGLPGLALFLVVLFYPGLKNKRFRNYFFISFFIIAFLSMLTEDTLESQPGVSFFSFFYILFLLGHQSESTINATHGVSKIQD